jgi:hypothetical protein
VGWALIARYVEAARKLLWGLLQQSGVMSDGAFAETTLVKHEGALETPWRQMEKSKQEHLARVGFRED